MGKTALITGIDGFVTRHCALRFLDAGYEARGSVRDPDWAGDVRQTLAAHADVSKLDESNDGSLNAVISRSVVNDSLSQDGVELT